MRVLKLVATLVAATALGCSSHPAAPPGGSPDGGVPPFQADPPAVYVAKIKNVLVGLPPTDDEIKAVTADPKALDGLVDQWMALPEYQQKMLVFFELAFQQTQISNADFTDMIPNLGLGAGPQINLLLQNVRESFARTVLAFVQSGRPITDAFSTRQLMMTPALKELYAFLDTRHVDDAAAVSDDFAAGHPTLSITVEASAGPIALSDSVDPQSPSFMHFYNPSVGMLTGYPNQACNVDPITAAADAYFVHNLFYGAIYSHKGPNKAACVTQRTNHGLFADSDFTDWTMVTLRAPNAGEATTVFYDLPALRSATELVLKTPRLGFFSTPAFGANWPTNTSNQMRVTLNQTLIVATGTAIDGTDATSPDSTPGLDATHAQPGSACFGCHQLLDPTRSILASTWSWYYSPQTESSYVQQKGLFAFQGVITPVMTIDDFAHTLVQHPLVPTAWAQKLCYWVNSAPCVADDPEFQRIVSVFQQSSLSWNTLVKTLVTSPITTNASVTKTTSTNGEVISVARRDHLCAAFDSRLGLSDICGLDATAAKAAKSSAVVQIVGGLPSDGYGRGATAPVLPNQPTLFYRSGLENICGAVADLVVDAPGKSSKAWSSTQPDAAIADMVATMLALAPSDPRSPQAVQLLQGHFQAAQKSGASASDALKSTFVTACLAPSFIGIGM